MFKHHCSYSSYDISDLLLKQAARANINFDKSFTISKRCPWNHRPAKFKLTSVSHSTILSTSQSYKHASDMVDIFSTKLFIVYNTKTLKGSQRITISPSGCLLITWYTMHVTKLAVEKFLEFVFLNWPLFRTLFRSLQKRNILYDLLIF